MKTSNRFLVQAGISFTILFFCLHQLAFKPQVDEKAYMSAVLGIVGYWFRKEKDEDDDEA